MESKQPLYPKVIDSNPELHSPFLSSSSTSSSLYPSLDSNTPHPPPPSSGPSLYPSLDMRELAENLFPDSDTDDHNEDARTKGSVSSAAGEDVLPLPPPVEEKLVSIPGAILHLIDDHHSVELGAGDFSVVHLRQGENTVAVLARIGDSLVQWPLARDEAVVKLDDSHYFFSLHVPPSSVDHEHEDADDGDTADASSNLVNYGLTFASKGQEKLLKELDAVLENYSSFSVKKVEVKEEIVGAAAKEVVDGSVTKEVTPAEVLGPKKEMMERRSAAYWTTLAPNVEDYSHSMAKLVAMGSGQLIKGIIWTGDVTADRLKWGEDLLKKRITPSSKPMEVSKRVMRRMRRLV